MLEPNQLETLRFIGESLSRIADSLESLPGIGKSLKALPAIADALDELSHPGIGKSLDELSYLDVPKE